jgi:hypothetical protein
MARCGSCGGDRYTTCRCLVVDDPAGSTIVHGIGSYTDPYWIEAKGGGSGGGGGGDAPEEVVVSSEVPINADGKTDLWVDSNVPEVLAWIGGNWVPVARAIPGPPGTLWFTGDGPPQEPYVSPIARVGDLYLDRLTGDYYRLTSVIDPFADLPKGVVAMVGGRSELPSGVKSMV